MPPQLKELQPEGVHVKLDIEVSRLWVQDLVRIGEITIHKISTHDNLANTLTKHVGPEELKRRVEFAAQNIVERAA